MSDDKKQKPLIEKIKEGLIKSGFPLEMEVGKILKDNNWKFNTGNFYTDLETQKIRELDIAAAKNINTIEVVLYIECKKSDDRQIVLYEPYSSISPPIIDGWIKNIPNYDFDKGDFDHTAFVELFFSSPLWKHRVPVTKNILVTKGSQTVDNTEYRSAINGLTKKFIFDINRKKNIKQRTLCFYILVFEGMLFHLTEAIEEPFDLREIDHGRYYYEPNYRFEDITESFSTNVLSNASEFVIEIMTPIKFVKYLHDLENTINSFNSQQFGNWGKNYSDLF